MVIDVFLNMLVLLGCFFAVWVLRFKDPDRPRVKVPGGWFGLALITVLMTAVVILAIVFNYLDSGWDSISWALIAMAIGAILYFPIRRWIKPGNPGSGSLRCSSGRIGRILLSLSSGLEEREARLRRLLCHSVIMEKFFMLT